ncbi:MAG: N-acetyltransferase family protein [Haloferacaceae archaeon]
MNAARERVYPDEPAGPFPTPPRTIPVGDGREATVRAYDGSESELEALVAMYDAFDPADRAQGIPPTGETRIREWLDTVLREGCHNVIAWVDDEAVGHATLVPDADAYELAIFVLQAYQGEGIGTALVETLLGHGADCGVERVWLTVERWNTPAIGLYRKVGFEPSNSESFELEMSIRLDPDESVAGQTESTG